MKPFLPLAVLAASLLAGCSASPVATISGHQAVHATPVRPTSHPPSTPRPTPTASAARFAAVVNANEAKWRSYEANIDACTAAAEGTSPDDYTKSAACVRSTEAMEASAKAATASLLALSTPPQEIEPLITRVLAALAPIKDSKATAACSDVTSQTCLNAVDTVDQAATGLVDALDAWDQATQPQ